MLVFHNNGVTSCSALDKMERIRGFSFRKSDHGLFFEIHYRVKEHYALAHDLYYRNRATSIRLWGTYGLPVEDYAERGEKVYLFENMCLLWKAITSKKA
jgi:hypothetical protein